MEEKEELEKLRANCAALEKQVKLLVLTEIKLRRTRAELERSKEKIEDYSKSLEQKVEARTKELKESQSILQTILNSLPVGIVVIDKTKNIRRVNEQAVRMMKKKSQEEIIGNSCHTYFCKSGRNKCSVAEQSQSLDRFEEVLHIGAEEQIPIMKDVVPIVLNNEEVLLEAFIDISMLKSAAREKEKYQRQLLQSEKMAAIGQLAGGVAHEINNPMGVILGFAEAIVSHIKEDDPLAMPLNSIQREAIRCKMLVNNLLTFSRAGKTYAEETDINRTIAETLPLIEAQSRVRNIELVKEYDTTLPYIMVNKNQIQQVIINLCNNALDATGEGGRITITTGQLAEQAVICVKDTGEGMSDEVKKHLYEPFFTTKEVGKGTGLGLSICYEIIKDHNGTIDVVSEVGKGTAFQIRLPL